MDMQSEEGIIYTCHLPGTEVLEGEIFYYLEVSDSIGQTVHHPRNSKNDVFRITVSADRTPSRLEHTPIEEGAPGEPLLVKVKAEDPSGIERIVLYYRQTRQAMQYSVITMQPDGSGTYSAIVPGHMITKEFDFMYYLEAVDKVGNGVFFPNPDFADPHLIVKVKR